MSRLRGVATVLLLWAVPVAAQPVFDGDPVDPASGLPYVILPGAPLFLPGDDEKYRTGDDVVQSGTRGDVDLVVRSVTFAGAIPPPAASVAAAPIVVAGGSPTGIGSDAVFQLAISDGAVSPPAGHPLGGPELDGRGALVLAYADLDGDGVIGPTTADGNADNEVERQEAMVPVGRQVALFGAGMALGDIAVSLGAPASSGGLGVALAASAVTGPTAPVYLDGTPIATLLPLLFPADLTRVTGNDPPPPDPDYLVDVELEVEEGRWFIPSPGDPQLGEPYAIPLDGSSISNDLLQARAGAAVAAGLARPIDAGFVAGPTRRVLPAVGSGGGRLPVESVEALDLADDGPGNGATLALFPADRLGNPTDPAPPSTTVVLHGGAGLAIVAPDSDGDPLLETIVFASAEAVMVTIDDTGASDDSGAVTDLVATVDSVPSAAVRVTIGSGAGGAPVAFSAADLKLGFKPGGRDRLRARASTGIATLDPVADVVRVALTNGGSPVYDRELPAGSFRTRGRRSTFRDARGTGASLKVVIVRRATGAYTVRLAASGLALPVDATIDHLQLTLTVGTTAFRSNLACSGNAAGNAARCR